MAGVSAARAEVLDLLDRIDAEDRDEPAEIDLLALAQHDSGVFPDPVLD
ncbi:MAG: hypothetical protein H0U52_05325 [Chloroflexi bacterium]|nr:hypothetical protein [Chloroflexota bacterium]